MLISGQNRAYAGRNFNAKRSGFCYILTKSFGVGELLARVRVALRRGGQQTPHAAVQFGQVEVDLAAHHIAGSCPSGASAYRNRYRLSLYAVTPPRRA